MITRHEFLAMLHDTLKPRGYLEIGVFHGDSLILAQCPAIGIDPSPHVGRPLPKTTRVYPMTSDQFFEDVANPGIRDPNMDLAHIDNIMADHLDLAFIDGMHLFEYALRDFQNIERYANQRTVIVFDDVLPRNQHEAAREQCPGDWTGDVWKTAKIIEKFRKDLKVYWINTFPTGTAVVYGFANDERYDLYGRIQSLGLEGWGPVPDDVLNREHAVEPDWALRQIATYLLTFKTQESDDADSSDGRDGVHRDSDVAGSSAAGA